MKVASLRTGVRILLLAFYVVMPGKAMAQQPMEWMVDPTPDLVIEDVAPSGEVVLERPIAATQLSDGTVVVADMGAASVLFFAPSGELIRRVGRRGEGPGEFQILWWMGQCGVDSLYAFDAGLHRMTVVDADGSIVRDARWPPSRGAPLAIHCSRSGTLAYVTLPDDLQPIAEGVPVERGTSTVHVSGDLSQAPRPVLGVPSGEMVRLGGGGGPRPLGKQTSLAVTSDHLYVGTADSATITRYDLNGQQSRPLRLMVEPREPSASNVAHAVSDFLAMVPARAQDAVREMLSRVPPPPSLPPYWKVLVDPMGVLWVVLSAPGDGETSLRAVSNDGAVLATITLPAELDVYEVGEAYVLGLLTGQHGRPSLLRFQLKRASEGVGDISKQEYR